MHLTADEIITLKKQYFYPNSMHFYKNPPHIVRGEMQYLFDDQEKRYTDFFAGVTVLNCGHSNPEILASVKRQLETLQHTSIIYLTAPMVTLAERLAEKLPGDISKTFFCSTGTEANEGALLLSRIYTGRKGFMAFEGGLHGRSHLTMSVTGIPMWRIDPYLEEAVYFAKPFVVEDVPVDVSCEASLQSVDEILREHGHEIAACIVEPIQGNGGMNTPNQSFFKALKKRLEAYGVLLIVDEIQTGFARTGSFFAIEQFEVVPDIITYAKALGNGIPIGAFSAIPAVAASFNKPSASTLGGNPVSCTAGIAVLDYIEKHDLCQRAKTLGEMLRKGLEALKDKYPIIKEVRGLGLMLGMAFPADGGAVIIDEIIEKMKDRGFIVGKNGLHRNVLAFQPPLVVEASNINDMLTALDAVIGEAASGTF